MCKNDNLPRRPRGSVANNNNNNNHDDDDKNKNKKKKKRLAQSNWLFFLFVQFSPYSPVQHTARTTQSGDGDPMCRRSPKRVLLASKLELPQMPWSSQEGKMMLNHQNHRELSYKFQTNQSEDI
jgi:hypothetical protein